MQGSWGAPWLQKSHPNFFFIYAFSAVFHLWRSIVFIVGPSSAFATPSLTWVQRAASPFEWGVIHLVVALVMFTGLFRTNWSMSRLGLLAGFIVCAFYTVFLALPILDGVYLSMTALPVWFGWSACQLSQLAEPPFNPATTVR